MQVMVFGFPVQFVLVVILFKQREKGVKITDTRVRLTTEVLVQYEKSLTLRTSDRVYPRFYKASGSSSYTLGRCSTHIGSESSVKQKLQPFAYRRMLSKKFQTTECSRQNRIAQSALIASVVFIPVLAAILSFVSFINLSTVQNYISRPIQITYGLTGHDLNIGVIFSALQLFNVRYVDQINIIRF